MLAPDAALSHTEAAAVLNWLRSTTITEPKTLELREGITAETVTVEALSNGSLQFSYKFGSYDLPPSATRLTIDATGNVAGVVRSGQIHTSEWTYDQLPEVLSFATAKKLGEQMLKFVDRARQEMGEPTAVLG